MGKGSGGTRASSSSSPRGLAAIGSGIPTQNTNVAVIAGMFTTRQGRDINLDEVAREGRADETWERKPLTPTSLAGTVPESTVTILGEERYRYTHGKMPSSVGAGAWMFRIGSSANGSVVEFPVVSYSDAKRAAKKIASKYGYRTITVMT